MRCLLLMRHIFCANIGFRFALHLQVIMIKEVLYGQDIRVAD
jgi:hypothetical protein